jgi:hypothetical protein
VGCQFPYPGVSILECRDERREASLNVHSELGRVPRSTARDAEKERDVPPNLHICVGKAPGECWQRLMPQFAELGVDSAAP